MASPRARTSKSPSPGPIPPEAQQPPQRSTTAEPAAPQRSSTLEPGQLTSQSPGEVAEEIEGAPAGLRISFYVEALDDMIDSVLDLDDGEGNEEFLFTATELAALKRVRKLDYEARYLLIRLYLRADNWLKLSSLNYKNDIKNLAEAAAALFAVDPELAPTLAGVKEEEIVVEKNGMIDLTMSDGEEEVKEDVKGKGKAVEEVLEKEVVDDFGAAALSEEEFALGGLEEILNSLSGEQLQTLGRQMKVANRGTTRSDWIAALLKTSKQATLSFFSSPMKPDKGALGLGYDKRGQKLKQVSVVANHAKKIVGEVIRVSPAYRSLLTRLSLIYHRTAYTSNSTTSLTSSLLARFGKRHYANYTVQRTYSIFTSRDQLIAYERALDTERRMELCTMEGRMADGSTMEGASSAMEYAKLGKEEKKSIKEKFLKEGIEIFESIYEEWKAFCAVGTKELRKESKEEGGLKTLYYRKRFEAGAPLTRVVYHAATMYAKLHDRPSEIALLRELLAQRSYRRGKRGMWYDRLALILMTYPSEEEEVEGCSEKKTARLKKARLTEALELCKTGLEDSHLIYHPSLQRRINRLESSLEVPKSKRQNLGGTLKKATLRIMEGTRTDDMLPGRKSCWLANDGDEVSVEGLSLEGYAKLGWSGIHSETGILTMLFSLLFWDIIFHPVPGVFQTAYQSAPLDLSTDGFSEVRKALITKRLRKITNGHAPDILAAVDDRERPLATWCVGVRWKTYSKEVLLEIVECMGGPALAAISRVLAEDFVERSSGGPDLILWDTEDSTCMFAEVKGPGDSLSSTQQVWIDVLLSAGIPVELCKVMTSEDKIAMEDKKAATLAKRKETSEGKKKRKREVSSEEEDEEED